MTGRDKRYVALGSSMAAGPGIRPARTARRGDPADRPATTRTWSPNNNA
ncbi:hypothetical protein BZL30_7256 [Mycobacterium kansasii]|uniref:Uncharacterized protein n=1 Tax=Mycobacterium kansasii TaxID=1768 RepID=A0A1V3WRW9_MYCKA|nr:hypothetical protein BZL30_7256 [Mycobacterium kansasii]